jgi:hypothetical protein
VDLRSRGAGGHRTARHDHHHPADNHDHQGSYDHHHYESDHHDHVVEDDDDPPTDHDESTLGDAHDCRVRQSIRVDLTRSGWDRLHHQTIGEERRFDDHVLGRRCRLDHDHRRDEHHGRGGGRDAGTVLVATLRRRAGSCCRGWRKLNGGRG